MKLRLVRRNQSLFIYCANGTTIVPKDSDLIKLLTKFKHANLFKGSDGVWSNELSDMEDAPGETLAYIDASNKLVILDENIFKNLIKEDVLYVSVSEYAAAHNKCRAMVKNLCNEGRLQGAYKTSSGWLIPENTPYPKRKPRTIKPKTDNE